MTFNMSGVENATHLLAFFEGVNAASNNILGLLILVSTFTILLFALLRSNPVPESFMAAATATTVVSLIFLYLDLTSLVIVITFTIIWSMSGIALYRSNSV